MGPGHLGPGALSKKREKKKKRERGGEGGSWEGLGPSFNLQGKISRSLWAQQKKKRGKGGGRSLKPKNFCSWDLVGRRKGKKRKEEGTYGSLRMAEDPPQNGRGGGGKKKGDRLCWGKNNYNRWSQDEGGRKKKRRRKGEK